jgi:hypothetical protein
MSRRVTKSALYLQGRQDVSESHRRPHQHPRTVDPGERSSSQFDLQNGQEGYTRRFPSIWQEFLLPVRMFWRNATGRVAVFYTFIDGGTPPISTTE